jgi:hypothetical protein
MPLSAPDETKYSNILLDAGWGWLAIVFFTLRANQSQHIDLVVAQSM